jgi:hypothetical protein
VAVVRAKDGKRIIVGMSGAQVFLGPTRFLLELDRFETDRPVRDRWPAACRARNRAARRARYPHLVFLDVDCIPLATCLSRRSGTGPS